MSDTTDFYPVQQQPLIVVISGLSGAGKDTVLQRMKARAESFHFVVTYTDRKPRDGEVHGIDYFFCSPDEFAQMVARGEFLEHARVYDHYKGVPKVHVRQALDSGKDVLLRVDVQGAKTIRRLCPDALLIFLTVENEQVLEKRLRDRGTEDEKKIRLRLKTARKEVKHIKNFDFVILNRENHLDETVDQILSIVKSEHQRVQQRKVTL